MVDVNETLVNKLDKIIPNPRINCRRLGLGKIDYRLMMDNPDIECVVGFADNGRIIESETDPLIVKYCELNSKHHFALEGALRVDKTFSSDTMSKSQHSRQLRYENASKEIKTELSKYGYSDMEVSDILVKFLYGIKNSKHKVALWMCYGDCILSNLEKRFKQKTKTIQCVDCGEWFETGIFDSATERCEECAKEHKRELARIRKRRQREKNKCHATL